MFKKEATINLGNLVLTLSKALDIADVRITKHSQRVAYITSKMADNMGLSPEERADLFLASLLHDIGISSSHLKIEAIKFNTPPELFVHCITGSQMVGVFPPFARLGKIIYHHHDKWKGPNPSGASYDDIPLLSQIIFLADRLDVQLERDKYILFQKERVMDILQEYSGTYFHPDLVEQLRYVSKRDSFWLDMASDIMQEVLQYEGAYIATRVDMEGLKSIALLFAQIIDRKNKFTGRHSRGVAKISRRLAECCGFSRYEQDQIEIAGLLHDLGKLAIPDEILEYPGSISPEQYSIVKMHPYYTYHLLRKSEGFEVISSWAAFHHERIDETGYPFRIPIDELSLGSKIVAVSDTYQALAEERPYRKAFTIEKAKKILRDAGNSGHLDRELVELLCYEIDFDLGE